MRVYAMLLPSSGGGGRALRGQKGELPEGGVTDTTGASWNDSNSSFRYPPTNWGDPSAVAAYMAGTANAGLNGWLREADGYPAVQWKYADLGTVGKLAYTVIDAAAAPSGLKNGFALEDAAGNLYPIVRMADVPSNVAPDQSHSFVTAAVATLAASALIYKGTA